MADYLTESIENARLFKAEADFNGNYQKEPIPSVFVPSDNEMSGVLRQKFVLHPLSTTYEMTLPEGKCLIAFSQRTENTSLIHSITSQPENRYLINVVACANMDKVRIELMEFYRISK